MMGDRCPQRKVVLIGMGDGAASALASLVYRFRVAAVFRDESSASTPNDSVATICKEEDIAIHTDLSTAAVAEVLNREKPDCVVMSSYDRILPEDLLDRYVFLNVHYAPLPRYRGRAPLNWAIINQEAQAGISMHTVSEVADGGNLLFRRTIPIQNADTAADLLNRLNKIQEENLAAVVDRLLDGFTGEQQDHDAATYGCRRLPEDGEIDWSQPTEKVAALIRALAPPFPGAFSFMGTTKMVLVRAEAVYDAPPYSGRIPGRVVGLSSSTGSVDVLTGDGVLRILEIKTGDLQGGVAPSEVIKTTRCTLGLRTTDLLARIEDLESQLAALERKPAWAKL